METVYRGFVVVSFATRDVGPWYRGSYTIAQVGDSDAKARFHLRSLNELSRSETEALARTNTAARAVIDAMLNGK